MVPTNQIVNDTYDSFFIQFDGSRSRKLIQNTFPSVK